MNEGIKMAICILNDMLEENIQNQEQIADAIIEYIKLPHTDMQLRDFIIKQLKTQNNA